MIGAIVGDVVGSVFEFNNIKTKEFTLVSEESEFTDDTVLTIAVMDWISSAKDLHNPKEGAMYLQKWARKYPDAGFGGYFYRWKDMKDPKPYNSFGNGSGMRISAVGFLADTEEEVKDLSRVITSVTHNHPEGIKGAEVTAMMIFKARHGATMEELRAYAESEYPEIKELDYEELRKSYYHGEEICQVTMPQAFYCFLISNSFEDCLRTTISIGGDCDTTAAINCPIAEAFYGGVPKQLEEDVREKLTPDMLEVLDRVERIYAEKNGK